jgi:hypothetical protein
MVRIFKRKQSLSEPTAAERLKEARAAREETEMDLQRVKRQWPVVQNTAEELNIQLEKNHFAERFRTALGG